MKKVISLLLALVMTLSLCVNVWAAGDGNGPPAGQDEQYAPFADVVDDKAISFLTKWTEYGVSVDDNSVRYFYFNIVGVNVEYSDSGEYCYCVDEESLNNLKAALAAYDALGSSKAILAEHTVYDGEVRPSTEEDDLDEAKTTVGNIMERFYRPMIVREVNNGIKPRGTAASVDELTGPAAAVTAAKAFLEEYITLSQLESGKGLDAAPKKAPFDQKDASGYAAKLKQAVGELYDAYEALSYDARLVLDELSLSDGVQKCLFSDRIQAFLEMANPQELGSNGYESLTTDAKEFFDKYFNYYSNGFIKPKNGENVAEYGGSGITKNVAVVRRAVNGFLNEMTDEIETELNQLAVYFPGGPNGKAQVRFNDLMATFMRWLERESTQELELREAGYSAPEMGTDFTVTFPKSLKNGDNGDYTYTYTDGVLTINVKEGSAENWMKAAMEMPQGKGDGIYITLNFENKDKNSQGATMTGNGVGGAWTQFVDGTVELHSWTAVSNMQQIASVNTQDGKMTITPLARYSGNRMVVVWGGKDADGRLTENSRKFMVKMIVNVEEFSHQGLAPEQWSISPNRIHVDLTQKALWQEEKDWDMLTVRAASGKSIHANVKDTSSPIGVFFVDRPGDGYTLDWSNCSVDNGNPIDGTFDSSQGVYKIKLSAFRDDKANEYCGGEVHYKLVWVKSNEVTIEEYLTVKLAEGTPKLSELGKYNTNANVGDAEVKAVPVENAKVTAPSNSGMLIDYKSALGYFYTSFGGEKLPSSDELKTKITIEPTGYDKVVYYRVREGDGDRDLSTLSSSDVQSLVEEFKTEETYSLSALERRSIDMVACDTLKTHNGTITVYFAATQQYRWKVVQWLNESKEVVGYTYIYGQNGAFVNTVNTPAVSSPDQVQAENKNKPFVIGGGFNFECEQFPQDGKVYEKYFQLGVWGENLPQDGKYYEVYMPYEYFGITGGYEEAKQYKAKPVIRHYDYANVWREDIEGEYTEYGIYFKTKDFSPFVISCDPTRETPLQPDRPYYSGVSTPTISAVKTADAARSATDYTSGIYGLTFRSTAAFSTFKGVQVDGKTIAAANYIAEDNGGIEVYLKAVYLRTLKDGRHTVTILSDAGNVTMNFTIGGVDSPTTFDAGIALYVGMALTSATGLAWVGRKRS